eukprot:TRINITY_DN8204_c2_g1_i1.p1 TRINITY_DN8204_c2_g1~~TRINITY_DN8204_c2_g1_i1.p1  ORF type:complete len:605 (+),score=279.74 TRINITY_DN8204_c2_g1_i1:218-1816(+)
MPPPPPGFGIPPPPGGFGRGGPAVPKSNMKTLHWKKLKPNAVQEGSLWSTLQKKQLEKKQAKVEKPESDDSGGEIGEGADSDTGSVPAERKDSKREKEKKAGAKDVVDLSLLQTMFEKKKVEKKEKKKAEVDTSKSHALDGARAQNIGIMISFLKKTPEEILKSLQACEADMTRDVLEGILAIVPQEDEVEKLSKELARDPNVKWGPPEKFCHLIGTEMKDCADRLKLWIFTLDFPSQYSDLSDDINTFDGALTTLLDADSKFTQILSMVLEIGNTMNQGTMHGNTAGFSMETLGTLGNVKSNDGKHSLLDFVVMQVLQNQPELESFTHDLHPVAAARSISLSDVSKAAQSLSAGRDRIRRRIDKGGAENDLYPQMLQRFLDDFDTKITDGITKVESLSAKTTQVAQFYGEDPFSFDPGQFFSMIIGFSQEFDTTVKAHREKELRKKRQEAREAKKKLEEEKKQKEKAESAAKTADDEAKEERLKKKTLSIQAIKERRMRLVGSEEDSDWDDDKPVKQKKTKKPMKVSDVAE